MAKKKRNVKVEVIESEEQFIVKEQSKTGVEDMLQQRKNFMKKNATPKDEEYKGPEVEWKHDGATKAAEAIKRKKQGITQDIPVSDAKIPQDDDPAFENLDVEIPEGWQRVNPPSGCLFYDFKSIGIRPLTPKELVLVTGACQAVDVVGLHDVLSNTITCNIRKLWWTDYIYLLFWHRLNSYVKVPYKIKWNSIYGNSRVDELRVSNFGTSTLKMTKEQWDEYKALGLHPPTVRDAELMSSFEFSTEQWRLWLRAQYLEGKSIKEKIEKLDNVSVDTLLAIKDFSRILDDSSVSEYINVCDIDLNNRFKESKKFLKDKVSYLTSVIDEGDGLSDYEKGILQNSLDEALKEYTRLNNLKAGEAEPLLETIKLSVNELTFLPRL